MLLKAQASCCHSHSRHGNVFSCVCVLSVRLLTFESCDLKSLIWSANTSSISSWQIRISRSLGSGSQEQKECILFAYGLPLKSSIVVLGRKFPHHILIKKLTNVFHCMHAGVV